MTDRLLPAWAEELRRRYLRGEATQFLLHGNVHDLVLHDGKLVPVTELLTGTLLAPTRELIVQYNLSTGVRFLKGKAAGIGGDELEEFVLSRSAGRVLPALERVLLTRERVAVLLDYAEMLAPAAEASFTAEGDRASIITLHRWSLSREIEKGDNLVVLVTGTLAELHPLLVGNPRVAAIPVPMPDPAARRQLIAHLLPGAADTWLDRLAETTAGLKAVQIKAILEPTPPQAEDPADRLKAILALLGGGPEAEARARKLQELTRGLPLAEVRELVAPGGTPLPDTDGREQVLSLIARRKREIIERECFGLIEFVQPAHGFEVVGGMDEVKRDLLAIARHLREGRRELCPMGLLFVGPMGTGKTFLAETFARETGLTTVKLKNFRSKWVGATEGNLDRILGVIGAIGQVVVIIDEGDRAFGSGEGESDGGTGSRVIARIKEFMSDTANRGRVLFILMTNRPDRLDIDIKRAGRLDRKIPFFFAQSPAEVEPVLAAQLRKHGLGGLLEFPRDREGVSERLVGYSNADLEALVLLAGQYAAEETGGERAPVSPAHLQRAVHDYLPARDLKMLEYMELLAVFEASNRRLLPQKYAALSEDELQARLALLRREVGGRR